MNLLISSYSDPYINLATEEFLLKNCTENFLFLYVNQPSVVVGKHQIAQKEINAKYTFDNNIKIARRLSGGGAVYHDHGNLNFSFVQSVLPNETISYKSIVIPIFQFLLRTGTELVMSDRNDIMAKGKKISGSAMHIFKNRVLAHGTLLINSNLANLSRSLNGKPEKYTDKSIQSRRAKVTNLKEVNHSIKMDSLLRSLKVYLIKGCGYIQSSILTDSSINMITELAVNKYSTIDWIYGYSPKYTFSSAITLNGEKIQFSIEVEKGIIEKINIESMDKKNSDIILIMNNLVGLQHNYSSLKIASGIKFDKQYFPAILEALF
jgi:lipoate-protein ligase A